MVGGNGSSDVTVVVEVDVMVDMIALEYEAYLALQERSAMLEKPRVDEIEVKGHEYNTYQL